MKKQLSIDWKEKKRSKVSVKFFLKIKRFSKNTLKIIKVRQESHKKIKQKWKHREIF
jgi:hypothetical protein